MIISFFVREPTHIKYHVTYLRNQTPLTKKTTTYSLSEKVHNPPTKINMTPSSLHIHRPFDFTMPMTTSCMLCFDVKHPFLTISCMLCFDVKHPFTAHLI